MQIRAPDRLIADMASRQHGVVARRQLLGAGLGREAIAVRLRTGRLHRLHPGVYAVGHRVMTPKGKWFAGVMAGGEGAALSHRSAAALWRLRPGEPWAVEVTTPRSTRSQGMLLRHCARLLPDEMTIRDGIPVTSVARTLIDLAAVVPLGKFERALRESEVQRLPLRPSLLELLARHPGRRGARSVRRVARRLGHMPSGVTRSPLEDRFLRLLRSTGLPMPETNVRLSVGDRPYEADCLWRQRKLIVELDGHEAHGTRAAFESDRERDRCLQAGGWTVVRATSWQVDEAMTLTRDLHLLLSRESA